MIIESVHIQSFGKIHNLDLDLGEGLCVIEGPNESGKSTLAAFFRFMFYGFPSHTDGVASPRRHRVSWDDGRADGYLIVKSEKGRFRIERTCEKVSENGYQENCAIVNLETGENAKLTINGRHDPCIVPRALPVIEAAAALAACELLGI